MSSRLSCRSVSWRACLAWYCVRSADDLFTSPIPSLLFFFFRFAIRSCLPPHILGCSPTNLTAAPPPRSPFAYFPRRSDIRHPSLLRRLPPFLLPLLSTISPATCALLLDLRTRLPPFPSSPLLSPPSLRPPPPSPPRSRPRRREHESQARPPTPRQDGAHPQSQAARSGDRSAPWWTEEEVGTSGEGGA